MELVINATPSEVVIALLNEKRLVKLHREKTDNSYSVGDIYLGRVKKRVAGLNAAFVDVGHKKDAFLHYLDLGPQVNSLIKFTKSAISGNANALLTDFKPEPDTDKAGKIINVLSDNQELLVQIAKEPISTKGPRITSEITLAGRYLVLLPFSGRVSISQRIKNKNERERLLRLIKSIKPQHFGVIIRTVAENKKVAQLDSDLKSLLKKWEHCFNELKHAKPPKKVLGELDRTSAILRDIMNTSFNNIHVNDAALAGEIKNYIKTIAPDKYKIVRHYKGKQPIFDHFGIEKQIKASFGKYVTMQSGAYLVIEHTEALHVIDVNSGNTAKSEDSQEANALRVNLEAAEEIARQLHLRDMGGIIVVDFIDLLKAENRKQLHAKIKEAMQDDKAKHNVLPPSKFGLVQITRQRVRPEMNIETSEKCPSCDGTGEIQSSILLIDEIKKNLHYILHELKEPSVMLKVHPFVDAYLKKGIPSERMKWYKKYRKWINVKPVTQYQFLEYRFFNAAGDEIKI